MRCAVARCFVEVRGAAPQAPRDISGQKKVLALEIGGFERFVKDRSEAIGPVGLGVLCFDQVVSEFNQYIGASMLQRMLIDGIAGQVAGVGFVVANLEVGFLAQAFEERMRKAGVMRIKHADLPRAFGAVFQLWRERVDREQHRVRARGEFGQGGVVGAVALREPLFEILSIGMAVGRDDRAVVEFHQQRGVICAAIGVNHKAREVRADYGAVEHYAQGRGNACGSDVKGDVAVHVFCRQAEVTAIHEFGHRIGGVIDRDAPAARTVCADDLERFVWGAILCHIRSGIGQLNPDGNCVITLTRAM